MSEAANRRQVTSEGMKKLEEKLAYLTGPRRAEVAEKLNIARGYGDLSETPNMTPQKTSRRFLKPKSWNWKPP